MNNRLLITPDMPILHPDRCCIECQHMYIDTGDRGYSEVTPGSEFDMSCEKQRWEYKRYGSEERYRQCILAAKRCPDFTKRAKS